jgi:hypothetical protein
MKSIVFSLLFISLSFICIAQSDFKNGYIILHSGDTLYGFIDYQVNKSIFVSCKFKKQLEDKEINYSPNDIHSYRYENDRYYISKDFEGKKYFFEFLLKGLINVYFIENETGEHYFVEKEGMPITELPYEEYKKFVDGRILIYRSSKHIGILNHYMSDSPRTKEKLQNTKKVDRESMIFIAKNYHQNVCTTGEKCVEYAKSIYTIVTADFLVGLTSSNIVKGKESYAGGVMFSLHTKGLGKSFSLRTGLMFDNYFDEDQISFGKTESYIYHAFRVPIQFQYIYPTGFF